MVEMIRVERPEFKRNVTHGDINRQCEFKGDYDKLIKWYHGHILSEMPNGNYLSAYAANSKIARQEACYASLWGYIQESKVDPVLLVGWGGCSGLSNEAQDMTESDFVEYLDNYTWYFTQVIMSEASPMQACNVLVKGLLIDQNDSVVGIKLDGDPCREWLKDTRKAMAFKAWAISLRWPWELFTGGNYTPNALKDRSFTPMRKFLTCGEEMGLTPWDMILMFNISWVQTPGGHMGFCMKAPLLTLDNCKRWLSGKGLDEKINAADGYNGFIGAFLGSPGREAPLQARTLTSETLEYISGGRFSTLPKAAKPNLSGMPNAIFS